MEVSVGLTMYTIVPSKQCVLQIAQTGSNWHSESRCCIRLYILFGFHVLFFSNHTVIYSGYVVLKFLRQSHFFTYNNDVLGNNADLNLRVVTLQQV